MRRLSVVVLLLAACASAVTGCTTVSAPPPPARAPGPSAPRIALTGTGVPAPPPDHEVLETVRADPVGDPSPARVRVTPERRERVRPRAVRHRKTVARRHRVRRPRTSPAPSWPAVSLPGRAGVCALARAYGGWAAGSRTSGICRGSYR